jgi:hypothetical protein
MHFPFEPLTSESTERPRKLEACFVATFAGRTVARQRSETRRSTVPHRSTLTFLDRWGLVGHRVEGRPICVGIGWTGSATVDGCGCSGWWQEHQFVSMPLRTGIPTAARGCHSKTSARFCIVARGFPAHPKVLRRTAGIPSSGDRYELEFSTASRNTLSRKKICLRQVFAVRG